MIRLLSRVLTIDFNNEEGVVAHVKIGLLTDGGLGGFRGLYNMLTLL